MTFRHATDEEIKRALYQGIYYWQNRNAIQAQQRTYRKYNKGKVRGSWKNASKRYRDKNRDVYKMYQRLVRLARKDGLL